MNINQIKIQHNILTLRNINTFYYNNNYNKEKLFSNENFKYNSIFNNNFFLIFYHFFYNYSAPSFKIFI